MSSNLILHYFRYFAQTILLFLFIIRIVKNCKVIFPSKFQNVNLFSDTSAGIICMCDAEGNGLESLMGVFRLPNADVRVGLQFVPSLSFNLCKYLGADGFL